MQNPFFEIINQLLPEPQASLLSGILFGGKANLSKDLYQSLITSGTVHMIALSGQNVSLLINLISRMMIVFGRRISIFSSIVFIVSFLFLVGFDASIVRAAVMGVIGLLAVFFGKKSSVILSLVLAAGLMLLVNPLWLWDISFQLSFLATMGIIILGPSGKNQGITIKAKIINELKIHLHTSIAAQVFTVPLIFFYFNRVSLVAPLSNVLIGPVIPIIMTLGLLLCLVGFVWLPLGYPFAWVLSPLISYLVAVVRISSEIPFASLELI